MEVKLYKVSIATYMTLSVKKENRRRREGEVAQSSFRYEIQNDWKEEEKGKDDTSELQDLPNTTFYVPIDLQKIGIVTASTTSIIILV